MAKSFFFAFLCLWFAAVAFLCCLPLLRADRIVETQGNELASHVRNAHEYALALREGQLPPLVAPTLDGGRRVPVFQYYSGTAYVIPGLLARRGVEPYTALKIAIFLHLLAAGWFIYLACRALGLGAPASIVAGTAGQVFAFAGGLLLRPGAYSEFTVLACIPLVFYCGLRLVGATRRVDRRRWLCLTALALAYFIPLHPVQSVLCGTLALALLTAYALFNARTRRGGPGRLLVAVACGAAASAWFWWPLARDRSEVSPTLHADSTVSAVPRGTALSVPENFTRIRDRRRARYWTEVAPGREGLYQLPIYFLPSGEVSVNGHRVKAQPSADRAMVVVPLQAGPNFITIRTRPTVAAWRISLAACAALAAGALVAAFAGRSLPSVSVRHL